MRADVEKPFIVPVFIPHSGCPHQCVFCNQNAITGGRHRKLTPADLPDIVNTFLQYKGPRRKEVQISFYGGTFLGLPTDSIQAFLTEAARFVAAGQVDSIRFSTRPDTIDHERLDLLKAFPVSTIELGVQSMDDGVLQRSGRGHSAQDTRTAVDLLKKGGYRIGLQLMTGLPGDTAETAMAGALQVAGLRPDFVRIYPAVVLNQSPLAQLYTSGRYIPLSLTRAVCQVRDLYLLFQRHRIPVIRMGLQPSSDLEDSAEVLAGPYHPAFGYLVFSRIFLDMAECLFSEMQNVACDPLEPWVNENKTIHVHSRSVSEMRGPHNRNLKILKERYHFCSIDVAVDSSLAVNEIRIENKTIDSACLPLTHAG